MLVGLILVLLIQLSSASDYINFTYNGFSGTELNIDGLAEILSDGLLRLTNTTKQNKGHAFHPNQIRMKNSSTGDALSFSTSFVFGIQPLYKDLFGHGIAFVLSRSNNLSDGLPSQYLGLFDEKDVGNSSDKIVAVELDINYNPEFGDINNNHVGIDVNTLRSLNSSQAGYYSSVSGGGFQNLSLASGEPMQVWVEYDDEQKLLNVTLAPLYMPKPKIPLLSSTLNLSSLISYYMYVGFSSSTGSFPTSQYILGWSFTLNGKAQVLDISHLPSLPRLVPKPKSKLLTIGLPVIVATFVLATITAFALAIRRKMKFAELREDWEQEYGPQRFSYKDLYMATKGFRDKELLGAGGFGKVYRGILPHTNTQIAVKKVSHESRQGMKEFIAEIVSIGRLRHKNLVQLLGYCRRKGELLLVYDFMPNGSLNNFIFNQPKLRLSWDQRFHIIKGVASGLFYLHEEWDQVVIHRDIKASNILLDLELNGQLGDFGLARLYDHGTDPQTTHVVGTLGYLAPELTKTGKATTSTDVYAFGAFLLEIACGRRPIETKALPEEMILVDWVLEFWKKGKILEARDPNLANEYNVEEVEMVLKIGLLCSHPRPIYRPRMWMVMQVLEGNTPLPDMSLLHNWDTNNSTVWNEGFDDYTLESLPSTSKSLLSTSKSTVKGGDSPI